jgi:hypothetical protein
MKIKKVETKQDGCSPKLFDCYRTRMCLAALLLFGATVGTNALNCDVCVKEDNAYLAIETTCRDEGHPTACYGGCHQTLYTHRELCVHTYVTQTVHCVPLTPNPPQYTLYYQLFWPCTPREFEGSECPGCDIYAEPYSTSGPEAEVLTPCMNAPGCGG